MKNIQARVIIIERPHIVNDSLIAKHVEWALNEWLKENNNVEIVKITQSEIDTHYTYTIFYKKEENNE